jgi:L-ascorbate metabolism protein UlaG (beta-lactamase superfamily)
LVVRYIGHATVLIELDGVRFLTDPLLRKRVAHLRRAVPLEPIDHVDAVLISHGHYDHLDLPSLRMLRAKVIVPRGLGPRLRGFEVAEVDEGDEVEVGPVIVRATHAEHDGGRPLFGDGPALGYAILGSQRAFFAGDTDLFDGMDGLEPGLDVALLPVWGWGPRLGPGHLDPERAARAAQLLRPSIAVPIHWGTFFPRGRRPGALLTAPPREFAARVAELAPHVTVRVLEPGASLALTG